jgi:hypothetical protein
MSRSPLSLPATPLAAKDSERIRRQLALEDLILGLAAHKTLDELRPCILVVYPELLPDLEPAQLSHPNRIRAAFFFWLRGEIEATALLDYAVMIHSGD